MDFVSLALGTVIGAITSWVISWYYYHRSSREMPEWARPLLKRSAASLQPRAMTATGARAPTDPDPSASSDKAARDGEFVTALATGTLIDSITSRRAMPQHRVQMESALQAWSRLRPQFDSWSAGDDLVQRTESWLHDVDGIYRQLPFGPLVQDQVADLIKLVNRGKGIQNRFTMRTHSIA